ncbi:Histidine kinase-, DNA gyrase B-, and HSP90-like ATPase [Natronincola peptidivorans]|uniref:histidine kinase n=1 Tax=Natronincola peptidivorans TaxID=426128 RepID=A0A1I0G7Y9_9FIRM|nr:histidine kinase [Natronincola peptidivorans]SET66048.1 Histidine kinase-, DNA gyrase B-, and HSP90-like ATPase [Natronincola peptidivorans]
MKRKAKRSMGTTIKLTFAIIIIIMSIIFLYSNIVKSRVVQEYDASMKINILLSDLSIEYNNMWELFNTYIKNNSEETYHRYIETNMKINNIINIVTPHIKEDKDSSIYLRNLNSMYAWFKEEMDLVITREELNLETYEQIMNIRTMNYYISQHSSNLMSSYLQHTNSNYLKVLDSYKILESNLYLLLAITILVSIFIIIISTDNILRTVKRLSVSVRQLSDANWDIPDLEVESYNELDYFAETFNHMKNSIKTYIEELNKASEMEMNYQKEKIKNIEKDKIIRETQLKALKMQINPHFLFNNLNTVSRMAMFENADKTVELIDAVAKILRFNLSQKNDFILLKDELEIVKAFILIQRIKFEDTIQFNYTIDEELYDLYIPPMIIQLLVENAIKHGVSGIKKQGWIKINVSRKNAYCVISVEDNGFGISKDEIDRIINRKEMDKSNYSTGLGIYNIILRLQIYFNREDLLTIESEKNVGTKVEILIPIEESERIAKSINS